MSLYRRAAKRDSNEARIVRALRRIGVQVWHVSGDGLPDLLCAYRGQWTPVEVKRPRGKLTDAQKSTRALAWYPVVDSVDAALALFLPAGKGNGAGSVPRQAGQAPDATARVSESGGCPPGAPK